jgi:hypothetical protein
MDHRRLEILGHSLENGPHLLVDSGYVLDLIDRPHLSVIGAVKQTQNDGENGSRHQDLKEG